MKIYFAYGSNMNREQMGARCPDAEVMEIGEIKDLEFFINERGVASVRRAEGESVFGQLWKIDDEAEASLDMYEGVDDNRYRKDTVTVSAQDGRELKDVLIYIDDREKEGSPRPGYMEKIISGAEESGLPADYIRMLRSLA